MRSILALLAGLVLGLLCLAAPAQAAHGEHAGHGPAQAADGAPADNSRGAAPFGCCTPDAAHCASPTGIVTEPGVAAPADRQLVRLVAGEARPPAARAPDLQPRPPRA